MSEITLNGRRVWYRRTRAPSGEEAGEALPELVLLHSAGSSSNVWLYQLRALRRRARCIAIDLPGHGKSNDSDDCEDFAAYAREVKAVLDAVGVERYVLVGHAMGAAIAVHIALSAPEQVEALGLISAGVTIPVSDLVFEALRGPLGLWGQLMEDLLYSPSTPRRFVDRSTVGAIQASRPVLLRDFSTCAKSDLRDLPLASLDIPTLLIAGRDDAMIPNPLSEVLAQHIPRARLEVIEEAGHMVMLEQHKRVNDLLSTLLHRRR